MRKPIGIAFLIALALGTAFFLPRYGEYRIKFQDWYEKMRLPYKIARLVAEPPDATLFIPIEGVRLRFEVVLVTWGGACARLWVLQQDRVAVRVVLGIIQVCFVVFLDR